MRIKPTTGNIYHIYNRGVEKRDVFLDESDYFRYVHDLFEFNNQNPTIKLSQSQSAEVGLRKNEPRKLLVELMAFCLMPNHIHFIVKQLVDNGITKFMRKIGTGYTNYFNKKYERVGPLFQGKYKVKIIKNETHFLHLPHYIHANPLDTKFPEWRNKTINNYKKAIEFLENYRWSSFSDYCGKKNFPSVTQRDFIIKIYNNSDNYKKEFLNWLKNFDNEDIDIN